MPYFKNNDINILLIHIPKTGGTSVEKYLSNKYNIPLNKKSLYTETEFINNVSYQHQPYEYILNNRELFNIDINNLQVISIVRNPYMRIISDMFYNKIIDINSKPDAVFWEMKKYLHKYKSDNSILDNHLRPQHYFLTIDNIIPPNIKILKTENLTEMMRNIGYIDFNLYSNKNKNNIDYMALLNKDSIMLINNFYKEDFELFGYDIIKID